MESLAPLIPRGRLHKHTLQRAFWSQTHQSWDALIPLGPWFLQVVAHWFGLSWVSGGANLSASLLRGALHGCIQPGLGCTHGPPVNSRPLAPSSVLLSHQPAQTGSSLPGASTVSSLSPRTTCSSEYGQHDSGLQYKQAGREGGVLPHSLPEGGAHPSLVQSALHHSDVQTYSRQAEHSGRLHFFFFFFFFFSFPSYISGVHHFWVRFLRM